MRLIPSFFFAFLLHCISYTQTGVFKRSIEDLLILPKDKIENLGSTYRYVRSSDLSSELYKNIIRKLPGGGAIITLPNTYAKEDNRFLKVNDLWKLSERLLDNGVRIQRNDLLKIRFRNINLHLFKQKVRKLIPWIDFIYESDDLLIVRGILYKDIVKLSLLEPITFIDIHSEPQAERFINNLDLTINNINLAKSRYPSVNGEYIGVAIQENNVRSSDIDLLGKIISPEFSSSLLDDHATNMSTIITGWGNSHKTGEGVARNAGLLPIDFQFLLPLSADSYPDYVRTTNHSYGTDINNYYGVEAREFDAQVYDHPEMVHVFSAGNKGDSTSSIGPYAGIPSLANLSGSVKQAKNIILVGAIDSFGIVESRSSRGPTFDGRVKPDLVAYGEDGTSGAAAIVSGTSILLQDYYFDKFAIIPGADLIRACLIASAKDIYTRGPDYISGYGIAQAYSALKVLDLDQFIVDEVEANGSTGFLLSVPPRTKQVRIALTWNDAPANEGDYRALINDLDLKVTDQRDRLYLPQVLNHQGSQDDLLSAAKEGEDHLNNSELIIIDNPLSTRYLVTILATDLTDATIPFSLAYHFIPRDTFKWEFPSGKDKIISSENAFLRWNQTWENAQKGRIFLKNILSGEDIFLQELSGLGDGTYIKMDVPMGSYQLEMKINNKNYISDTFTIYPDIQLDAVNLCGDELLLEWDNNVSVDSFHLLTIPEDTLTSFMKFSNSNYGYIDISELNTPYIAIRPEKNDGIQGGNSYTINYEFQNPPCYISTFRGLLVNDDLIRLNLALSTLRDVQEIRIFKSSQDINELIATFQPDRLEFELDDTNVLTGDNNYYTEILLSSRESITSEILTIEYIPEGIFDILQNPVEEGSDIVVTKNAEQEATLELFNASGNKVKSQQLRGSLIFIDTSDLPSGAYPYIIFEGDDVFKKGMIIII